MERKGGSKSLKRNLLTRGYLIKGKSTVEDDNSRAAGLILTANPGETGGDNTSKNSDSWEGKKVGVDRSRRVPQIMGF